MQDYRHLQISGEGGLKILALITLSLGLSSCTTVPDVPNDQLRPGIDSNGLSYTWRAFEQSYFGSGGYIMTPDGNIYSGGKRIDKDKVLWRRIESLVEQYAGHELAENEYQNKVGGSVLLVPATFVVQESEGPECLSHWTDYSLRVKVGDKRAWTRGGECDSDYSTDKAGSMILQIFTAHIRQLDRNY